MKLYVTVGLSMLAGAALLEAALIPGLVLGGAAVLAPKYLTTLRRRRPRFGSTVRRPRADRQDVTAPAAPPAGVGNKEAIAKTGPLRVIVPTLDLTTKQHATAEPANA